MARPSASDSVSLTTVIGCHGGTSLRIAPGRVCQANTSSSGWPTTLAYSIPMLPFSNVPFSNVPFSNVPSPTSLLQRPGHGWSLGLRGAVLQAGLDLSRRVVFVDDVDGRLFSPLPGTPARRRWERHSPARRDHFFRMILVGDLSLDGLDHLGGIFRVDDLSLRRAVSTVAGGPEPPWPASRPIPHGVDDEATELPSRAPIHTQATISLLVTTAVTKAAGRSRPIPMRRSASPCLPRALQVVHRLPPAGS